MLDSQDNQVAKRDRLNPVVFFSSSTLIIALAIWSIIAPTSANHTIDLLLGWISEGFGWYYFLAATLYIVFVVVVACSRFGNIKLGPEQSKPEFSLFTWAAMLFAAGIGIDLMFFAVAEPVTQFLAPPEGQGGTNEAARQAVVWTMFHYGVTGWAMYALMGMTLAYFSFRYNLPLTIRSALYPLIGKRIHGPIGHTVDTAAVLGTIFGIATSLGIGVVQLNYGLNFLFGVPEGLSAQAALILLSVIMATISVVSGVDKGIRRLSELNVLLAILLILFVLFAGDTIFLLNALVLNVGDYLDGFLGMTLNTFAFDRPVEWLNSWTLFFWAWWIAWAPFVGLFLARISRGRTIRQFVAGTLIIPFIFTLIWLSVFGNSALDIVLNGNDAFGEVAMNHPERAFYSLLAEYPWVSFSASLATVTGLLFYVTSADSGSLVLGNFTSYLKDANSDAPNWLRIFWSVAIGLLTLAMLSVGGVPTLQSATIIMGLPFSFVIFFIMIGLYKSLKIEAFRQDSHKGSLAGLLSGRLNDERGHSRSWRQRLSRSMTYPGRRQTLRAIDEIYRPAMKEVAGELERQGATVHLTEGVIEESGMPHLDLHVSMGDEQDFNYQLWPRRYASPSFAVRSQRVDANYYRLEVYLLEGTQGYDLMGYTREQVINDILDQYERHLHFLHLNREAPGAGPQVPDEQLGHEG
ncbi:choline transporter [Halotalea alkalilenta]|uniref:choline transporter n=1 Tax=Halotalea alkalilenta TaxID=376489 RepID=UPI00047F8E4C|nr:choline transporter [Halotalea alkalilenta]